MKRVPRHSLRAKILFPLALVMVLVGALSALQFGRRLDKALVEEFSSKGRALARSLSASAQDTLLTRDAATVQGFIDEYKGIHGVGYVYVLDNSGGVLAHTFVPAFPDEFLRSNRAEEGVAKLSESEVELRGRHYLDIRAPILAGALGYAHVGMDLDQVQAAEREAVRSVLLATLVVCVIGFGLIFYLLNGSIRQVIHLSALSKRIEGGDLEIQESESRNRFGEDEIGVLARNFFRMIHELKFQKENLESQVEERTRKLRIANVELVVENSVRHRVEDALRRESRYVRILQDSAMAANAADSPQEALRSALEIVGNTLDFPLAHVFLCAEGPAGLRLESAGIWHKAAIGDTGEFERESDGDAITRGLGLPVRALISGRVCTVIDLGDEYSYKRQATARRLGLRGAVAVPVKSDGQVAAVMEFFSRDVVELEAPLENVLALVGLQVGRVFERSQARDQLEAQRMKLVTAAKMSSLGEMAGGVAHEINNPLAIIKSLSAQIGDLLDDEQLDKGLLRERAQKLEKTSDRIAKIVQGLRTFSRDGSNDPFEEVPVATLLEETLSFCRERLQKNGVSLTVDDVPEGLVFEGRATQISQVLVNLLHNADDAIAHLPSRWIRITARDAKDSVELRIRDSGAGISAEVQKKLFQPFFTTKEIGKGTGMGLSISLGIMRAHGGELSVDSAAPNTCFVLRVPKRQTKAA